MYGQTTRSRNRRRIAALLAALVLGSCCIGSNVDTASAFPVEAKINGCQNNFWVIRYRKKAGDPFTPDAINTINAAFNNWAAIRKYDGNPYRYYEDWGNTTRPGRNSAGKGQGSSNDLQPPRIRSSERGAAMFPCRLQTPKAGSKLTQR